MNKIFQIFKQSGNQSFGNTCFTPTLYPTRGVMKLAFKLMSINQSIVPCNNNKILKDRVFKPKRLNNETFEYSTVIKLLRVFIYLVPVIY